MVHHRGFLLDEIGRGGCPLNGSLRHDAAVGEALPEGKPLHRFGGVEIHLVAVAVHQVFPVLLQRKGLEHPVRVAGGWDFDAGAPGLLELFRIGHQLIPGGRRLFRVEPGFLEGILVVIKNDRAALERDSPGFSLRLCVQQESGVKVVDQLFGVLFAVVLRHRVDIHNRVHVEQREQVGGEHDRDIRSGAALQAGLHLRARVGVAARIDGVHLDVGVLLREVRAQLVDDLGEGPSDGNRVVKVEAYIATRGAGRRVSGGRSVIGRGGAGSQ